MTVKDNAALPLAVTIHNKNKVETYFQNNKHKPMELRHFPLHSYTWQIALMALFFTTSCILYICHVPFQFLSLRRHNLLPHFLHLGSPVPCFGHQNDGKCNASRGLRKELTHFCLLLYLAIAMSTWPALLLHNKRQSCTRAELPQLCQSLRV